jgi:hypothetical protein
MKRLAFYLLLLISLNCFAGDRAGNGGDVVVCKTGDTETSVELLDITEARMRDFDFVMNGNTIEEKVFSALNKFRELDLYGSYFVGAIIPGLLNDFLLFDRNPGAQLKTVNFTDYELTDVNDSFEVGLPVNCKIKQLIIFNPLSLKGEKKFYISKKLWKKLDLKNKAAAIIHEALYIYFSGRGWTDSRFARYINHIVNSHQVPEYSITDYLHDAYQSQSKPLPFYFLESFAKTAEGQWFELMSEPFNDILFRCNSNIDFFQEPISCLPILPDSVIELIQMPEHKEDKPFQQDGLIYFPIKFILSGNQIVGYETIILDTNLKPIGVKESIGLKALINTLFRKNRYDGLSIAIVSRDGKLIRKL